MQNPSIVIVVFAWFSPLASFSSPYSHQVLFYLQKTIKFILFYRVLIKRKRNPWQPNPENPPQATPGPTSKARHGQSRVLHHWIVLRSREPSAMPSPADLKQRVQQKKGRKAWMKQVNSAACLGVGILAVVSVHLLLSLYCFRSTAFAQKAPVLTKSNTTTPKNRRALF